MQILMGASYFVLLAAAWNTRQCGNKCVPMFRGQAGRLCGIRADIVLHFVVSGTPGEPQPKRQLTVNTDSSSPLSLDK